MKKTVLIMALLATATLSFGQLKSKWTTKPVYADGKPAEWERPFGYYDSQTKLMFSIANDDKNLYLCFETTDEASQMKIMRAGMEISLSAKGKSKHNAKIVFPIEAEREATPPPAHQPGGGKSEAMKIRSNFLLNQQVMVTSGFATKNGKLPIKDSLGLSAFINWEGNKMVYEVVIPLTEFYGADYTPEELTKEVTLNATVKAMERPNYSPGGNAGASSPNSNGMGGGSVTQPGGGMGGIGSGGNGSAYPTGSAGNYQGTGMGRPTGYPTDDDGGYVPMNNSALFERAVLKEKFILAKKP